MRVQRQVQQDPPAPRRFDRLLLVETRLRQLRARGAQLLRAHLVRGPVLSVRVSRSSSSTSRAIVNESHSLVQRSTRSSSRSSLRSSSSAVARPRSSRKPWTRDDEESSALRCVSGTARISTVVAPAQTSATRGRRKRRARSAPSVRFQGGGAAQTVPTRATTLRRSSSSDRRPSGTWTRTRPRVGPLGVRAVC